jgi:hypothetical protein
MSTPQYFYIILLPSPGRIECQEVTRLYRLQVELEDLEYQNTVHALPKKRGWYKGEEGRWEEERGRESGRDISDYGLEEVPENLT